MARPVPDGIPPGRGVGPGPGALPGSRLLVAVTGWGQDEDRRRSREAGFDHHLTKPVDPEAIAHLIDSASGPCGSVH